MSGQSHAGDKLRTMILMVGCESLAFVCSLVAALLADSLTLWANCLRIGVDLPASFFALYVTHRIVSGKTGKYHYGLGKWENLAALLNVPVMLIALVFMAIRAVGSLQNPQPITGTGFGLIVLLVFTGFNIALLRRFLRLHREASSPVIYSQFVLYRNATAASVLSILALVATRFAGPTGVYFDIFGALVLGILTIHAATILLRQSLAALLDEAVEESLQLRILNGLAGSFQDYRQLHHIRSRHSGDRIYVDLFLEFEPEMPACELIERSMRIKKQVEESLPGAEAWVIPVG